MPAACVCELDCVVRGVELLGIGLYGDVLVGFAVSGIETRVEGEPQPFAGRVTEYYDSETNPLFELEIDGRRVLVPAADEFFAHIDFESRSLRLVLPEGLLNMEK